MTHLQFTSFHQLTGADWTRRSSADREEPLRTDRPGISHQVGTAGQLFSYTSYSWLMGHPGAWDTHHSNRDERPVPFSQRMNTAPGTTAQGGTDTPSHVVPLLETSVLAHRDVGWRARVRHHPSHACLMQVHGCVKAVTPASPMAVYPYRATMAYGIQGRLRRQRNTTVSSHVGKHDMTNFTHCPLMNKML